MNNYYIMINDIYIKILNYINIKTHIKYLPDECNDGEQMRSIFYKNIYPMFLVCKNWNLFYKKNMKL